MLGGTYRAAGRFERAETFLGVGFDVLATAGCTCGRCLPELLLQLSILLYYRSRNRLGGSTPAEATACLAYADRALLAAPHDELRGRAFYVRGDALKYAAGAQPEEYLPFYREALRLVEGTRWYSRILQAYSLGLAESKNPADLEEAMKTIEEVESRFPGQRNLSLPRALTEYIKGHILIAQSQERHRSGRNRQKLGTAGRKHLKTAHGRFLRSQLPLEASAVAADASAASFPNQEKIELYAAAALRVPDLPEILKDKLDRVVKAASASGIAWKPLGEIIVALRELREVCEELGAEPPLFAYPGI